MRRSGPLALLLVLFLDAVHASAQEHYRTLVRDLDEAALLEPLAARSLATLWSGVRVLVPEKQHAQLVDPAVATARRTLGRPETAAALSDLLTLHESGELMPVIEALARAVETPGSSGDNLERLALIPAAAERAGPAALNSMLRDVTAGTDPVAAARAAKHLTDLPPETWAAIEQVAAGALERNALTRFSKFVTTGKGTSLGLEEPRKTIPPLLCFLSGENRPVLHEAAAYLENYSSHTSQPELTVSAIQWVAAQLDEPQPQNFISKSLSYERLPQLQKSLVTGIEKGAVRETVLDYADFLAGSDERVRVDPDTWKTASTGSSPQGTGLSGLDFLKLSALTLFTVNRLDEIPSEPRSNGLKQSLSDEMLDYLDYQLALTGTKTTISPLFDVMREFLSPKEDRVILVTQVREFARYMTRNDPEPVIRAAKIWLSCDTGAPVPKAVAALLDGESSNGDGRLITPLVKAFSSLPARPFVPLVVQGGDFMRDGLENGGAFAAALAHEQKSRVLSKLAIELSRGNSPLLPAFDPLARGLLREAPVFRRTLSWQTEERIRTITQLSSAALETGSDGSSDFTRGVSVLSRWAAYRNPVSGRPLTADAGLVILEAVRNGLVHSVLDAGVAIRRKRGDEGMKRLLNLLRDSLDSPHRQPAPKSGQEAHR